MVKRVEAQKRTSTQPRYPKHSPRAKSRSSQPLVFSLLNSLGKPFLVVLFALAQFLYSYLVWKKKLWTNLSRKTWRVNFPRLKFSPRFLAIQNPLARIKFKLPSFRFWHPVRICLVAVSLVAIIGAGWFYQNILVGLPKPEDLITRSQKLTTQIFDRNGTLLYKIYRDQNRTLVPLDQIPLLTQQAFIAIEDKSFYQHPGISLTGTTRAIWHNLNSTDLQGGSTITQQLVKNALLDPRRSLERKLKELILAVETELIFGKEDILQMYLNEVGFGGAVYGIQEAAQQFFGKNVAELSLAESALLAGLPKAPTKFSPYGGHLELALQRQRRVLEAMTEEGYITFEEARTALGEELKFQSPSIAIKAPHFVQYVREFLVEQLGEDLVNEGGLQVFTTLDYQLQLKAEEEINRELDRIKAANVSNGAALMTNPATGEILAMVGSRNYFDVQNDGQVNVTTSLRQPGSAVKPINYSLAFEKGLTAASLIPDQKVAFKIGSTTYTPTNYDSRYHGMVSARTALANSYNVPAVILLSRFGVPQMAELAQRMGITSWNDPSRWGLSLTLGGVEVTMVDLAQAYSTFANLGLTVPLKSVSSVYNSAGQPMAINTCNKGAKIISCIPTQVLKPTTAFLINNILADPQARSLAFGSNSILNIPKHQVAVKTGTSNSFRDNWTIGYTSRILVAAWVGNNDNRPMNRVASGITGASPIWHSLMALALDDLSPHVFSTPAEIVSVPICQATGTLTCQGCPNTIIEYFARGTQPTAACASTNQTADSGPGNDLPLKTDTLSSRTSLD